MVRLRLPILAPITLFVVFAGFAAPPTSEPRRLVILHTNDMHASFLPHEAYWITAQPRPMVGGFRELFFVADSIRQGRDPVLMLDAGDVMTGNPITERTFKGAQGGALFEMMNLIGYDAWCPGNHDLDISQANLRGLAAIARFPTLSANVVNDAGQYPVGNKPSAVIERGGLRIGVIGVISQKLSSLVIQKNLVGLRVLSPEQTVQKWIDELRPKSDLLIALTHEGVDEDSALATNVRGLDVIVGGHSHTRLKKPLLINNVLIVQAGSNCENLGYLSLTVADGHVTKHFGRLLPLWAQPGRPSSTLTVLIDSMQAEIEKEYSEVIGTLKLDWFRKDPARGIATFITEAQRTAALADVAFMNADGIRKDLAAGPITKKDLFEVLPFQNVLTTFQLSGSELRSVLRFHCRQGTRILITGMEAAYEKRPDGSVQIESIEIGGKALDDSRMYSCVASDYVVGEAKRYIGIEIVQRIYTDRSVYNAVETAIRQEGVITKNIPYRIRQVSQGEPR